MLKILPEKLSFKELFPYIPLIIIAIILLLKPYYFHIVHGDLIYHLVRAKEIILNPIQGLFWDYMVYSPSGRAIWHPPLFHAIFAFLWELGGVRFANAVMALFQVLITVFIATWISKKEYGYIAGFFAGIFVLVNPRGDIFFMPMPANFIPILAVLTIYFLPKNRFNAFITSLLGIWSHMIGLVIFIPLLAIDNLKKNIKYILILLPSALFWIGYWIYFKNNTGANNSIQSSLNVYAQTDFIALTIIMIFGILGLVFLYKIDKNRFKLILYYLISLITIQILFADISRGFQYIALPMAIMAGLSVQKVYEYANFRLKKEVLGNILILGILLISLIGSASSLALIHYNTSWSELDDPIESNYLPLITFINENTASNETLWAESPIADNVAWMSGRNISNGRYGMPRGFIQKNQRINICLENNSFVIKNKNNFTIKVIPFELH